MIITRTPFRISFFGGGTDYPAWYRDHGGVVLATTIDKYCHITCRHLPPFFEHKHRIVYSRIENVQRFEEIEHPAVRGILEGRPIPVFNNGKMIRDFTYIDDLVDGVVRVIDRPPAPNPNWKNDISFTIRDSRFTNHEYPDSATSYAPYRLYNIGYHRPVDLMQYIRVLEQCLGKKAALEMLPMQAGDVPATYADIADLSRDTGFVPATSIEAGVARFVEWYRDYYRNA